MMIARTITTTLDELEAWVASEIAPRLTFMIPRDEYQDDEGEDDPLDVRTDHPTVYQSFVPGAERLAEGQHQAPSIAVQIIGGKDSRADSRTLNVRLVLTVWAPAHFDADGYHRSSDGWRDLFNGLDAMAVAVESAETIAGCTVDHVRGVEYGYLDIDGEIPDYYPYWIGKVDFGLVGASPANKRFDHLL